MTTPAQPNDPIGGVPQTLRTAAGITWRLLILLAGLVVVAKVFDAIFPVVFALFFALLVTAWTGPVMKTIERVKVPKVVAMLAALVLIATAIVTIVIMVIRSTIAEGPKLIASVNTGLDEIHTWMKEGPLHLTDTQVTHWFEKGRDFAENVGHGLLNDVFGMLGSIGTLIIAGSVFIFGVIFFLMQGQQIWSWFVGWMPRPLQHNIDVSGRIAWESISGYTRGIVVVAFADAVLVFVGLLILQVPLAPALAALVFIGAFIPVIGAPVATFFAAIVALAERGPVIAALVVLLTVIVGSFDGDVLQPIVMGKAVNLHPLAIVFAIAAGSIAMGIVGALVAVPIAGAIYGVAQFLTGRDPHEHLVHIAVPPHTPATT